MKKISIFIPCYNEEANVDPLVAEIIDTFKNELPSYDYEILFIDNRSTDSTRDCLRKICAGNPKVKAIFNARNFGPSRSNYHGILQTSGDCTICMYADFQTPANLIPKFVEEWEKGYKIVSAIKTKSRESFVMYVIRSIYYKLIRKMSDVEQIEHFTGFGLYDKSFMDVLRSLKDPMPYFRGIISELGYERKDIEFEQPKRRAGKSSYNLFRYYDDAMLGFTSYTKAGLRLASITGFIFAVFSFLIAIVYLVYKILFWQNFSVGIAPLVIGIFFLGSIQLIFLGIIGEYLMAINTRVMNRPLVVEEERINF
ncbi:MAG: glycosyltransferase family 2 protein [Fibromonadales bacterium]|nr:glycosyltransferase family 2 protein [Fibromonadales bacterium]